MCLEPFWCFGSDAGYAVPTANETLADARHVLGLDPCISIFLLECVRFCAALVLLFDICGNPPLGVEGLLLRPGKI